MSWILKFCILANHRHNAEGALEVSRQRINLTRSQWILRVLKCQFQICRHWLEDAVRCVCMCKSCTVCYNYVFIEYAYHYINKAKRLRPNGNGGGSGKPSTRCIAYLAPDANEDRWLLPVGAHTVRQGTEREGTIITQTHKHISRWWMVKNLNAVDTE